MEDCLRTIESARGVALRLFGRTDEFLVRTMRAARQDRNDFLLL